MEIAYRNKKVQDIFSDYGLMKKEIGIERTRIVKKRLAHLKAASCFGDYQELRLGHLEQLKGYEQPRFCVRITANDRLIFELIVSECEIEECTEVRIIGVCDYHGRKENWLIP